MPTRQASLVRQCAESGPRPMCGVSGYSLDLVLGEMNKKGAAVKIAILASRRNPYERRFRAVAPGGLAPASVPKSTVVMYAPPRGGKRRRTDRLRGRIAQGDARSGKIEEELNRTMVGVSRATQGERRIPWFSSSLVEDFSFATARADDARSAPPSVEAEHPLHSPILMPPCGSPINRRRARERRKRGELRPEVSVRVRLMAKLAALAPASDPATPPVDNPAIKELDKKIALNRSDGAAYYKRGQLYAAARPFSRAVKDFDEVIRLNPKDVEGLNNRCWAPRHDRRVAAGPEG